MHRLQHITYVILGLMCFALPAAAHDKVKTVVGGGPNHLSGLASYLYGISQIAADSEGNLYLLTTDSSGSGAVYKWSHGVITHIAGDHTYVANSDSDPVDSFNGDTGLARNVQLSGLNAIAVDGSVPANIYLSDSTYCIVVKIDQTTGMISPAAGSLGTSNTDSGPSCGFYPQGAAADPRNGDLYVDSAYDQSISFIPGPGSTTETKVGSFLPPEDCSAYPTNGLACPITLALDTSVSPANLYIGIVCRVDEIVGATGIRYTVAGSTTECGSTDHVPATTGEFNQIQQIVVTGDGTTATVKVADQGNGSIRQFTVTSAGGVPHAGVLTTIAGVSGQAECNPASTMALGACISPAGLATDSQGGTYIMDANYFTVDRILPTGELSQLIGVGNVAYPSNLEAIQNNTAQVGLYGAGGVFADSASSYIYVGGGNAVYRWNSASTRISDFAGNGVIGLAGDGMSALAPNTEVNSPAGMAKDAGGNLYFADEGNCVIRAISAATGILDTVAGASPCGYSGDGGSALKAQFDHPNDIAFDAQGNLFVADTRNCAVRKIDKATQVVTTIAGGLPAAQCYFSNSGAFSGDGGPAAQAQLWLPTSLSFDGNGNLYIADSKNAAIREIVAATGIIQTVAGIGGNPGYNGDPGMDGSGLATQALLNTPSWVKADANNNLFIADTGNNILRWITPAGQIVTFAGGTPSIYDDTFFHRGFEGDGGGALDALFYNPGAIDQDGLGNFYVADNNRIRQISAFPGYGFSTSSLTFATQIVGSTSAAQTIRISSIGPLKISVLTVSHGFKETDNCAHTELTAGQACEVQISFDPKAAGPVSGVLRIYSNALLTADGYGVNNGNPNTVSLSGVAIQ